MFRDYGAEDKPKAQDKQAAMLALKAVCEEQLDFEEHMHMCMNVSKSMKSQRPRMFNCTKTNRGGVHVSASVDPENSCSDTRMLFCNVVCMLFFPILAHITSLLI